MFIVLCYIVLGYYLFILVGTRIINSLACIGASAQNNILRC